MDLHLEDTITLWTPTGDCKIELMYGDITKLSKEDKVDLIMVSAFPGDYSAVKRTVLGALWHNLGINVQDLSGKRELDLRSLFNCWLSSPLTEHSPFKKLLCFERKRNSDSLFEQIRDLFRVFVPVFSNKETTVITPLLATGNQGFSKTLCLSAMVEGAAGWICAGLSLRCLKIVLYETPNQNVNKLFTELKDKWTKKSDKLKSKNAMAKNCKFDVYIMYEKSDKKRVQKVESELVKKKQDITVHTDLPKFDENKVWQGDIYKNMILSKKIVAILTPSFVKSKECLELFNMALCCGRLRKREMLLPFYFEQVDSMPVYMGLVQYFDCRIKKAGENGDIKVANACIMIINELNDDKDSSVQALKNDTEDAQNEDDEIYDLFISYSHKNSTEATVLLDMFSERNPNLKIFFDRNELTMGNLWQSTLYKAMSGAQCVVCLISSAYINSNVCQEEYNIALARYLSESEDILFIPLCIEELQQVPYWFGQVKMVDARGDNFKIAAKEAMKSTLQWLKNGNVPDFVCKDQKLLHITDIYPDVREKEVDEKFQFNKESKTMEPKTALKFPPVNSGKDHSIVISHAHDSLYCSVFLGHLLEKHIPGISINYVSDDTHNRMHLLDTARKIVIFLSTDFVCSAQHMQELHIALVRQRSSKGTRIVHIIQTTNLPDKPMFLNLIPCDVSLKDAFWQKICNKYVTRHGEGVQRKHIISQRPDFAGSFSCSLSDYIAFVTASYIVLEDFAVNNENQEVRSELNQVNILKMKLYLESEQTKKKLLSSSVPVNNEILVKLESTKEEENLNSFSNDKVRRKQENGPGHSMICDSETLQAQEDDTKTAEAMTECEKTKGNDTNSESTDANENSSNEHTNKANLKTTTEIAKTKEESTQEQNIHATSETTKDTADMTETSNSESVSTQIHTSGKNSETTNSKSDSGHVHSSGTNSKTMNSKSDSSHRLANDESSKTAKAKTGDGQVTNSDTNLDTTKTKTDKEESAKVKTNNEQGNSNDRNLDLPQVENKKASQKNSSSCTIL